MARLSVNINKIATLRNSRGKNQPDVIQTALDIVSFGAEGITVHPRPDERHIRRQDVYDLSKVLKVEFNIEGYPSPSFLKLIEEVRPVQCTLVPDTPEVLTSNAGWRIQENKELLSKVLQQLKTWRVRSSLFVEPAQCTEMDLDAIAGLGADRIELYTEAYAQAFGTTQLSMVLNSYQNLAAAAVDLGIGVNAGHDLNLDNLADFVRSIPALSEVSIGHALICDALYLGLETTVQKYKENTKVAMII